MRIDVLGPLRVSGDGITEPTRASQRRLLALFALEAGRRIGTERLIDLFWDGSPPTEAKASIQTHVSALRRLLGPGLIKTEGYGYRLDLDGVLLDTFEFDAAAEAARQAIGKGDWEAVLFAASKGLDLWRGAPFGELEDDEFARPEVTRLEESHRELWEIWSESLLRLGRPGEALPELERLVVEHPMRERLWEHLMTARYRLGRHAEALSAFHELNDHLAEMGLEPSPSIRRLEEKILLHDEELSTPPHNLPIELTSFIGRHDELADVAKLLGDHRLITLTGVGGSGKTRLAIQIATELLDNYRDGCWFVGLADLTEAELIPVEISSVLGMRPQSENAIEELVVSLRHEELLLVLDNCEHLRDGAASLARCLIGAAGRLKILATSREPLHVAGEVVYEIPPLDAPTGDLSPPEASRYDAVRLFADRASLVDPRFHLDDETYSLAGRICRRLDGIPLAIELAAAKVRSFSLEQIDKRITERLLSLGASSTHELPRHQTLEAAMDWSYELLDPDEQVLFARLAVFRGGFDVDMVDRVAGDQFSRDALDVLESLIDKSLVTRERHTPNRYRLLEPIRELARDRLAGSGFEAEVRRRHLEWCVTLAEEIEGGIHRVHRHKLVSRLGTEIENLKAGLETAVDESNQYAISLIASVMAWHWIDVGSITRARDTLLRALENVGVDTLREGELRSRLSQVLWALAQTEQAFDEAVRAEGLVRDLEASVQKIAVQIRLSGLHSLLIDQDPKQAIKFAREAVSVAEAVGDPFALVRARTSLGQALSWAWEVDEGLEVFRSALSDSLAFDQPIVAIPVYNHMFTALYLHPDERRDGPRWLLEEMEARFSHDELVEHAETSWLAYIFMQTGEWDRAREVIGWYRQRRLEGIELDGYLMTWGTLRWMVGDLDEATVAMKSLEAGGINSRWFHDYYPLRTDIAADAGDIETVRQLAETYLALEVDPSEEPKKLGALNPLVRAEVSSALSSNGAARLGHVVRAEEALRQMQAIHDGSPVPVGGSQAMETPRTHLAFAVAELSRLTGPSPELWRQAVDGADYAYFRLYAEIRLAEALGEAGDDATASELIEKARRSARRLGAHGLERLIKTTLSTND